MTAARSLALTVTALGVLALAVSAQQPGAAPVPAGVPGSDFGPMVAWFQHPNAHHAAAELARSYVKAEKESEKKEIRQKMVDVLNEQFNEQMVRQQKELEDLEKQIADLRAVLKKRAAAKGEIVDQRIEQLVREADGLGWTAPANPNPFAGQSYTPVGAYSAPRATPGRSTATGKRP